MKYSLPDYVLGSSQFSDTSRRMKSVRQWSLDASDSVVGLRSPVGSMVSKSLWKPDYGIHLDCIKDPTTSTHMAIQITVCFSIVS